MCLEIFKNGMFSYICICESLLYVENMGNIWLNVLFYLNIFNFFPLLVAYSINIHLRLLDSIRRDLTEFNITGIFFFWIYQQNKFINSRKLIIFILVVIGSNFFVQTYYFSCWLHAFTNCRTKNSELYLSSCSLICFVDTDHVWLWFEFIQTLSFRLTRQVFYLT